MPAPRPSSPRERLSPAALVGGGPAGLCFALPGSLRAGRRVPGPSVGVVAGLLEEGATVEIEATAAIPH